MLLLLSASLPPEMLSATIVTLPKPGKEPTLPQNFRPTLLLNVDVKVYAKILTGRLLLPSLVKQDRVATMAQTQPGE